SGSAGRGRWSGSLWRDRWSGCELGMSAEPLGLLARQLRSFFAQLHLLGADLTVEFLFLAAKLGPLTFQLLSDGQSVFARRAGIDLRFGSRADFGLLPQQVELVAQEGFVIGQ